MKLCKNNCWSEWIKNNKLNYFKWRKMLDEHKQFELVGLFKKKVYIT